ncbi:PREDICTED: uncharacterized protein LOC106806828 [Priapulus caudatus]|uniref:Uncharacterized protein LOC106806828 n=1 Tax=Priapulus caudatus TaxID=37621 RepID=A0ABM1DWW4_PRICU|nr:PREDICTED: uncharacterized protein LOC106806828 [Priapulus caudatus]
MSQSSSGICTSAASTADQKHQAADEATRMRKKTLVGVSVGAGIVGAALMIIAVSTPFWVRMAERVYVGDLVDFAGVPRKLLAQASGMENPEIVAWWMAGLWYTCTIYEQSNSTAIMKMHKWREENANLWPTTAAPATGAMPPAGGGGGGGFVVGNDVCYFITYGGDGLTKLSGSGVTAEVLRKMTRSTPCHLLTMLLLIIGTALTIMGFRGLDRFVILGAIGHILAGMMCALGIILYISAINDEATNSSKSGNDAKFRYWYGVSFFLAGTSFVFSQITAVINISLYLQRYKGSLASMSKIVPGIASHVDVEGDPEVVGEQEQLNPNHVIQEDMQFPQATV